MKATVGHSKNHLKKVIPNPLPFISTVFIFVLVIFWIFRVIFEWENVPPWHHSFLFQELQCCVTPHISLKESAMPPLFLKRTSAVAQTTQKRFKIKPK